MSVWVQASLFCCSLLSQGTLWPHNTSEGFWTEELDYWVCQFEISGEIQILQDAPTEPTPHTSLLYIPPLWRASRKTSEFQIKTILLENTFHRNWYHRVLPPTSTVRLFCTRDRFATPSVGAAVEKGFSTQRVHGVVKKEKSKWASGPFPTFQITSNQS